MSEVRPRHGKNCNASPSTRTRSSSALLIREAAGEGIVLADGTPRRRLPGLPEVDVGRRILRQHRVSLASKYGGASAYMSGPHRVRGRAVETAPRYATSALRQSPPEAKAEGLRDVEITTQPDNVPSQKVIEPTAASSSKSSSRLRPSAANASFAIGCLWYERT